MARPIFDRKSVFTTGQRNRIAPMEGSLGPSPPRLRLSSTFELCCLLRHLMIGHRLFCVENQLSRTGQRLERSRKNVSRKASSGCVPRGLAPQRLGTAACGDQSRYKGSPDGTRLDATLRCRQVTAADRHRRRLQPNGGRVLNCRHLSGPITFGLPSCVTGGIGRFA
jgi:hypothetical protein